MDYETLGTTGLLTPIGDTCRVITCEVGMGKDAAHLRETDESLMHRGHDLWLAALKWMSEGSTSRCGPTGSGASANPRGQQRKDPIS
jgi:hypothetical protein